MSDVPLRNIKNEIQYQFIRNRLEKLMPWISGSCIPIQKLSEDPPTPTPHKSRLWTFGTGWIFGTSTN